MRGLWQAMPPWMRAATAYLVAYAAVVGSPLGLSFQGSAYESMADVVRLGIEATAFLWAARRPDLPRGIRLTLRISGWTSVVTIVSYVPTIWMRLGGPPVVSSALDSAFTLAGYLGTLAALLFYPRTTAAPGERLPLVIDGLVTTGGLGLLSWTLVTQASQDLAVTRDAALSIRVFGVAQLALIAGLNVVVVRGLATPTPRAFWAFVAGQALYVPVTLLVQFQQAGLVPAWPAALVYALGVLPTLAACVWFRTDPFVTTPSGGRPSWLRDLNPIPLTIPIWLGMALLPSVAAGATTRALALGAALAVVSVLLAARLLLSARRAAALVKADADREHQRQVERLQAVGRLAGGIAHEFNNRLARIVGHADLGEWETSASPEVREHFAAVRTAALGAGELTHQLLAFSGRQQLDLTRLDVGVEVEAAVAGATRARDRSGDAVVTREHGPLVVTADASHLRAAVAQLVDNALEAMPRGTVNVAVAMLDLPEPLADAHLRAPAGRYVTVTVRDTGAGIAPEVLAIVCDPFYSTKPHHLGAGLGLASVHGFVASHAGGLTFESTVGEGTTVTLYLPAA